MSRPTSKTQLMNEMRKQSFELCRMVDSMTHEEFYTPFDFSVYNNKTEAHWSRDKDLRDVLINIYEWQRLLVDWIASNTLGNKASFLPAPYNRFTCDEMDNKIWQKYRDTDVYEAMNLIERSHIQVVELANTYTDEELFAKKYFKWTGKTNLASYFIKTTSAKYTWAINKLQLHSKTIRSQHK